MKNIAANMTWPKLQNINPQGSLDTNCFNELQLSVDTTTRVEIVFLPHKIGCVDRATKVIGTDLEPLLDSSLK